MKHALKSSFVFLFIVSSLACFSQETNPTVIASAGDVSKGSNVILEWTVGEPVIETASSASSKYTQGFHQPLLEVQKVTPKRQLAARKFSAHVYPNPSSAVLNIQLDQVSENPLLVSLVDAGGKVLLSNAIPANSTMLKINVSRLSGGAYILRIRDAKRDLQSNYKVIKAQQ